MGNGELKGPDPRLNQHGVYMFGSEVIPILLGDPKAELTIHVIEAADKTWRSSFTAWKKWGDLAKHIYELRESARSHTDRDEAVTVGLEEACDWWAKQAEACSSGLHDCDDVRAPQGPSQTGARHGRRADGRSAGSA